MYPALPSTCCFTQLFSWEVACLCLSLMPVYANANSSQLPGSGLKQEQMRRDWVKFTRKTILFDFDWNGNDSSKPFVRNFAWGMTSGKKMKLLAGICFGSKSREILEYISLCLPSCLHKFSQLSVQLRYCNLSVLSRHSPLVFLPLQSKI